MGGRWIGGWLLAAAAIGGCSAINALDETLILAPVEICDDGLDNDENLATDCADEACRGHAHCAEACDDGEDNDLDGKTDCEAPGCYMAPHCLTVSPLAVVPPQCSAPRVKTTFFDSFGGDAIDLSQWSVHANCTAGCNCPGAGWACDYPRVSGGSLDLRGGDNVSSTELRSLQTFVIGARFAFDLEATAAVPADCSGATRGMVTVCDLSLGLAAESEGVLSISLRGTERRGELKMNCSYRNQSRDAWVEYTGDRQFQVRLTVDPDYQQLVGWIDPGDGHGREVCRFDLQPREPPVRLTLAQGGARLGSRPLLESVRLDIDEETPPDGCTSVAGKLLRDDFCSATSFFNGWKGRPRVVRGPEGFVMLFRSNHGQRHADIGSSTSANGLVGWTSPAGDAPAIAHHPQGGSTRSWYQVGNQLDLGGLIYEATEPRYLAWINVQELDFPTAEGNGPRLFSAPGSGPRLWQQAGGVVTTEGAAVDSNWTPEAVVATPGGGYRGWFSWRIDDVPGIYTATSADGHHWRIDDTPVLVANSTWASTAVGTPAVYFTGEVYVMAYAGRVFGGFSAVGLAFSTDGLTWRQHAGNPLIVGGTAGFDDAGISPGSVFVQGRQIVVWTSVESIAATVCPDYGIAISRTGRLGVTVLGFEGEP